MTLAEIIATVVRQGYEVKFRTVGTGLSQVIVVMEVKDGSSDYGLATHYHTEQAFLEDAEKQLVNHAIDLGRGA